MGGFNNLAILVLVVAIATVSRLAQADNERFKDMNELYEVAKNLESDASLDDRRRVIYRFAQESKSTHCARHFKQLQDIVEKYRAKAVEYIESSKQQGGIFGIFKSLLSPYNNMKSLASFDPYLESANAEYEARANGGTLSEAIIDCDLTKLQLLNLDKMQFLLQTDVKYLMTAETQVINNAILNDLEANKFITSSNFYDFDQLTGAQRTLLREYYLKLVNSDSVTVGEALDHFHDPGHLIMGRLLDSCRKVLEYQKLWADLESTRKTVCTVTGAGPDMESFGSKHSEDNYNDLTTFCNSMFNAL